VKQLGKKEYSYINVVGDIEKYRLNWRMPVERMENVRLSLKSCFIDLREEKNWKDQ
jgi:hypothetical protein